MNAKINAMTINFSCTSDISLKVLSKHSYHWQITIVNDKDENHKHNRYIVLLWKVFFSSIDTKPICTLLGIIFPLFLLLSILTIDLKLIKCSFVAFELVSLNHFFFILNRNIPVFINTSFFSQLYIRMNKSFINISIIWIQVLWSKCQ